MTWASLLFIHWRVPAGMLRPLVPRALDIETFDGTPWVGLIPFTMRFRPTGLPPIPTMHRFHECNVRTYVVHDGEPGVHFFSLDAASRLAVWGARRLWRLSYHYARMELRRDGDVVRYSVDRHQPPGAGTRASLRCAWRAGAPRPRSAPGELAHFLTERHVLYTLDRRGRVRRGRIWHPPWSLREAELLELEDGLVPAAGITVPDEPPVLYHADEQTVEAWGLEAS